MVPRKVGPAGMGNLESSGYRDKRREEKCGIRHGLLSGVNGYSVKCNIGMGLAVEIAGCKPWRIV
jgi:hypothetical protein